MACIAAPKLPPPPGLSLLLPGLSFAPPPLPGLNLCCNFEPPPIPGSPIILPIGTILNGLATVPGLPSIMVVITEVIEQLNALLDQLQFSCPME